MRPPDETDCAPIAVVALDFVLWSTAVSLATCAAIAAGPRWLWIALPVWVGTTVASRRVAWWLARRMDWVPPGESRTD
ncbi:MAG: hypothetical protein AB7S26_24310 [Sandaracinaceae bacterium]